MEQHLQDNHRGEVIRTGVQVAIVGPPNAGKSSLLNHLARRDVAIVSPVPGTTRDVLEVSLDLGGYPVIVGDTAGIRETEDAIEQEGVRRARERLASAHLRLLVLDCTSLEQTWPQFRELLDSPNTIVVLNKADLKGSSPQPERLSIELGGRTVEAWLVSCAKSQGLTALLKELESQVKARFDNSAVTQAPLITRSRHRELLRECRAALDRFQDNLQMVDLAVEELRLAVGALGRIRGRVDVEEVLDVIFRDFCIGK
eukprot:GILI01048689.1.p1 GENE.GILI01048689.1~~GILI01048689.1.p1  ORF type:complete len:293 (+),score=75.42 GILI01048689.1:110-880(+)